MIKPPTYHFAPFAKENHFSVTDEDLQRVLLHLQGLAEVAQLEVHVTQVAVGDPDRRVTRSEELDLLLE